MPPLRHTRVVAPRRLVADRTRFVLDNAAWTAFNDALDRPAEVKPELRELFARSRPE